jgi:Phosphodiester glycosidase
VDVATESDTRVEAEQKPVRRPSRRRYWLRRLGVVLMVALLWLAWSIGGALTAPGTDPTSARLAEWARFHGLGAVVTALEQVQYKLDPPKVGGTLAGAIPQVAGTSAANAKPAPSQQVVLTPIPAQAQPALPNEGVWQPLVLVQGKPAIQAAFLRPDAQHTSYLVGVAVLDQKLVKMVLHPGFQVPGGTGWSQPSEVPATERDALLATFNSGFTMADNNGGYWQDGQTAAPLRSGAASMVLHKDGRVDVVNWDGSAPGPDVAAVRQNLGLLIDNGTISPDVDSTTVRTWGKTIGNPTFVWRSGVGIRKDGSLVVVVGNSMSVHTLANILHDAGAVRAMELDINKAWTSFMTYTHPSAGVAVPHVLTADEVPNPNRYLQPSTRDFVAVLTR